MLRKNFFAEEELIQILADHRNAGLPEHEVALMDFARQVTRAANQVRTEDIQKLREYGYRDEQILSIVLAAAMRNFFSKTLDALGASPDEAYRDLGENLLQALTVGRPFEPIG